MNFDKIDLCFVLFCFVLLGFFVGFVVVVVVVVFWGGFCLWLLLGSFVVVDGGFWRGGGWGGLVLVWLVCFWVFFLYRNVV